MQPPTLGGLGFSKRAPRVAPWGTSGWELPVRRKWYGVNLGRRPRPGQTGLFGCRALASCRRGEDSAANRLLPARTWAGEKVPQRSLGQKPRTGHVLTPRGVAEAPRGWPAPTLGRIQHQCRGGSPSGVARCAGSMGSLPMCPRWVGVVSFVLTVLHRCSRTCNGPPTRSRLPAGGLIDGPSGPNAVAASDPSRLMDAPLRYAHTHGGLDRGRASARNPTPVGHSRLLLQRQPHSTRGGHCHWSAVRLPV